MLISSLLDNQLMQLKKPFGSNRARASIEVRTLVGTNVRFKVGPGYSVMVIIGCVFFCRKPVFRQYQ